MGSSARFFHRIMLVVGCHTHAVLKFRCARPGLATTRTSPFSDTTYTRVAQHAHATDRFAPKTPAIFGVLHALAAADAQAVGRLLRSYLKIIATSA